MIQKTLFERNHSYTPTAAISRRVDPPSSHEAAREITESGRRAKQKEFVHFLVDTHPGSTAAELAQLGDIDRYLVSRRLPELEGDGRILKKGKRTCRARGRTATIWEVA